MILYYAAATVATARYLAGGAVVTADSAAPVIAVAGLTAPGSAVAAARLIRLSVAVAGAAGQFACLAGAVPAGCHRPQEVITTAQMAREVFETNWIKLELIGDDYTLQPDTLRLVETAEHLIKDGFKVLPYCTEDLILCQRLVDVGCQAVMPWAAPIGTGQGPLNPYALKLLRERLSVPLLVDEGLGLPSHACTVMEWGFDGVLLNTAVALAHDPVSMAHAFAQAVDAGRQAYLSGAMQAQDSAQASTPLVGTPFWHQDPGTNP